MTIRLIFLFISLFSFTWTLSQDNTQLAKKEQKFAFKIFEGEPSAEALNIPDRDTAKEGSSMDGDRAYLMKQQDAGIGYLLSTRAKGRYDYFDYIVAYAPDLSVLGLTVLVYRSAHGAAICQKGWLGQFEGYAGEELTLGKEIDAVAGATISATSMVKDMKRTHQLMIRLKEEGIIH